MIVADPRAAALDSLDGRTGFRALVYQTTHTPLGIAELARELGVSRQRLYRGFTLARAAGFGPELDALPKVRAPGNGRGRPAQPDGEAASRRACASAGKCRRVEGKRVVHVEGCPLRVYYASRNEAWKLGGAS